MKTFKAGQIVENVLPNGAVIVCRVIEEIRLSDGSLNYRLVDVQDDRGASDKQLIARNKTWAAPAENIRHHEADCQVCHKDGLVFLG
jgi:hypothetical protein